MSANFGPGWPTPEAILGSLDMNLAVQQLDRRSGAASVITGTNPAHDTGWSSSEHTANPDRTYETCTFWCRF